MNYNNFRRSRSPPTGPPGPPHPYGYDGSMRPAPTHRDFEGPYHHANPYETGLDRPHGGKISQPSMSPSLPPSHPSQMAPPMVMHHHYMDVPAHHQNYPPHYREQQPPYGPPPPAQPSSSYRSAISHRDVYMGMDPSSQARPPHQHQPPFPPSRSGSPPYRILCITNINHKISDGPVREALTSDFSRFGDISVSVCHDNGERLAYIYFRKSDEAREARQVKTRTLMFDKPIEIEPIYEPQLRESPGNISPVGPGALGPTYSPRRRSVSPGGYPSRDPSAPMTSNRRPPPPLGGPGHPAPHDEVPLTPPGYPSHRGSTPPDYGPGPGGYHNQHHQPSPTPPMAPAPLYDRRAHPGAHPYPPAHMADPYRSPPHDPGRQAYGSHPAPYPPPAAYGRDRIHVSSRSPYRDPYYPSDSRSGPPPPTPHHPHTAMGLPPPPPPPPPASLRSGRRRSRSRSGRRSNAIPQDPYRDERVSVRYRYPAEPPARYMSREFRREKFGSDPHPGDHDEGRPSRVLLVNNIDATKTDLDLKEVFEPFGIIEEIEVKKVGPDCSSALVTFSSMDGAYKAKTANNGRTIGNLRCRIVYGKVSASRRLWIGGLSPGMTVPMMEDECGKYGDIVSMDYTSGRPYCYVEYESANQAQFAAYHMRSVLVPASERKIRIEFVDPDRSEKLLPRHAPNMSHAPDMSGSSKPRTATESTCDMSASPHSSGGLSGRKRSVSPASDLSGVTKRICQPNEILPLAANTFKQERLVAAAAAKARTSSTTSSTASQSFDLGKSNKLSTGDSQDSSELNNNSSDSNNQAVVAAVRGLTNAPSHELTLDKATLLGAEEAPSLELLSQCATMREVVACCTVSWPGQIALRNFIFPAQIHLASGRKQLIDKYLTRPSGDNGHATSPLLRITQRWRLHPQPKLEEVKRRMQTGNLGILILTARHSESGAPTATGRPAPATKLAVNLSDSLAEPAGVEQVQQVTLVSEDGPPRSAQLGNGPAATLQNGETGAAESAASPREAPETPADKSAVDDAISAPKLIANATPAVSSSPVIPGPAGPSTPNHTATPPTPGSGTQSRPLRNLISYLEQKDAAGVISLSACAVECNGEQQQQAADGSASSPKLLYAFPPGDFALNLLKRKAPNLLADATKDEFLLGVIVGGNVEGGKI